MAGSSTDEKWTIEKLNGANWSTWKFQMKHLLLAKELWGMVDGTETLAEDAATTARSEFQKKSQKAFSTLVLAIGTSQLYLVTSCETPKDAWDALRSHFERNTLANKLFLKKRFFRMEMKEGTTIENHLKEMKELSDQLSAIDAPITEEDQVVTLLGSLPKSFSTLVTALEARVDEGLSLKYVQQALVNEEQKMRAQEHGCSSGADTPKDDSALVGDQSRRPKSRKPICYSCRQPGHFRRDCPNQRKSPHEADTAQQDTSDSDTEGGSAFTAQKDDSHAEKWLVDSGASSHMTSNRKLLTDYEEFEQPEKVRLGDGRTVDAVGFGNIHLKMLFRVSQPKKSTMYRVLYVPQLSCNLFSVRAAASKGNFVMFGRSRCWIRDGRRRLCGMGTLEDKLYKLDCEVVQSETASAATADEGNDIDVWHFRLGHASEQCVKNTVNEELATGINLPKHAKLSFCEGCVAGKMKRAPFKPVGEIRSKRKLQLVHSDVCGPMPTDSIGGNKYFVTFIDDYSRCCAVYFLKSKSEVPDKFKEFEARVFRDCGERIGTLRSDNGGEYLSTEFRQYLKSAGIHHELTVPHSPQQNGVAERMNRTLMESARSMMDHAGLPDKYWAEAVECAAYIRNRLPTTALREKKTPFEMWSGRKPNISHLKVFGCTAYAHIPDSQRNKLDKKAVKLRLVGYAIQSKGYRLLDERTMKVYIRRNVVFNERDFSHKKEVDTPEAFEIEPDVINESETDPEQSDSAPEQRRQSERTRRPPVRYGQDEYTAAANAEHVACAAYQIVEPQTMDEALAGDHSTKTDEKMLEKYGILDAKSVSTPADPNVELCTDDEVSKPVDSVMYQSMVGSLLYVAVATRPDISQAVGTVSKFNSSPSETHLAAVKRILHYLKGTLDVMLKFKKTDDDQLVGFSDADYAGDLDDRRFTNGNVFLMSNGTAVQGQATVLMEDNQGAICIAKNPVSHTRTKHIDVRYRYEMVADNIRTKPLPKKRFETLRTSMGLTTETSTTC